MFLIGSNQEKECVLCVVSIVAAANGANGNSNAETHQSASPTFISLAQWPSTSPRLELAGNKPTSL